MDESTDTQRNRTGHIVVEDADIVDDGECHFDCGHPATYRIEVSVGQSKETEEVLSCGPCAEGNRLYPVINDWVEKHPDDRREVIQ